MTDKFYKFPKHWLTDEPFCTVGIKPLAILMIANDLVDWSIKNNWIEGGRVFVKLSNATINEHLDFANATIVSCKKKLQDAGLIHIPKNGKGHADKWFLDVQKLNYSSSEIELEQFKNDTTLKNEVVQKLNESSSKIDMNQFNFDTKVVQKLNTNKTNIKTNNKTNYQDYLSDLENNKDLTKTYQVDEVTSDRSPREKSWKLFTEVFKEHINKQNKKPYGMEMLADDFNDSISQVDCELFDKAIEIAKRKGARHPNYTFRIVEDWVSQGITSVSLLDEKNNKPFEQERRKTNIPEWSRENENAPKEERKRMTEEELEEWSRNLAKFDD